MCKILLLFDQKENRRLLAEWLATKHEVISCDNDEAIQGSFDLCIVDGHALDRLLTRIGERKDAEHPVFLPVLLATSRHGVRLVNRHLWQCVDESITSPIEKAELQARVEILLRARRLSRENSDLLRQIEDELQHAATVQADLLPTQIPALPGFEIAARSVPARVVGGDFYDWQQLDAGTLTFTVGDAMGRGMSAALLMATVRAAVRTVARMNKPATTLEMVRMGLEADLVRTSGFVTLFHGELDIPTGRLRYVDAGHAHLFVLHNDGTHEDLKPRCAAIGIPLGKPYREGVFTFHEGDALIIYTDGILDANPDIGLDHAALGRLIQSCHKVDEMVDRLVAIATAETPEPEDDATAFVLRMKRTHTPAVRKH